MDVALARSTVKEAALFAPQQRRPPGRPQPLRRLPWRVALDRKCLYENLVTALRCGVRLPPDPSPKFFWPMSDISVRSTRSLKREVTGEAGPSLIPTIIHLWPFIWPSQRKDLKLRVWIAMALLL